MKKSKIYTKTGDRGETGLVSGTRIHKSDLRIDLYGEVDELNSRIGFAVSMMRDLKVFDTEMAQLEDIQCRLFDLGSNLACESEKRNEWKLPQIKVEQVTKIESYIDFFDDKLEPLSNFILPGGHPSAAAIHLCRTSSRKVERLLVDYHLQTKEELPTCGLEFLNRLSDYFFVLARYVNKKMNRGETIWKKD
ncbi:MAG: cob(I)yrinic acid a,c-diamide adenosyltransferase [Bacteriovoracaceae bacterium]|nr:cob(I)yrinic acid a,c-diamide adenosyltransferase [Bacteriovoracaceae bacterium]